MRKDLLIWILVLVTLTTVGQGLRAQWEMIGPDGSPDKIFRVDSFLYGTTTYGFYRSSDDGDSWKRLDKGLPQPWNHKYEVKYDGYEFSMPARTFNLASGDSGFYVLDANDVWQYKDSSHYGLYSHFSRRIRRDSFFTILPKPGVVGSAVHLSTDHGTSWIERNPPDLYPRAIWFIRDRIFAEVSVGSAWVTKLIHSDDYGVTWEDNAVWSNVQAVKLYSFTGFIIAKGTSMSSGNPITIRSTDNGDTWEGSPYLEGILTSVASIGTTAFALEYEYAYYTTDSGKMWYPLRTQDQKNMRAIVGNNRGDGYVALVEGAEYGTWNLCHLDTGFTVLRNLTNTGFKTTKQWLVHANDSMVIAMGSELYKLTMYVVTSVYHSIDKGASWTLQPVILPGVGITGASWKKGQTFLYTTGMPDSGLYALYRSSDHGAHWENIGPRHDSIFFGPVIKAITNDTIVVDLGAGVRRRFFLSHDGGTTWGDLHLTQPDGNRDLCFLNGNLYDLQIYPLQQLLRSSNGIVWAATTLPAGNDKCVEIFGAEGILYAATVRYISTSPFYTIYRSNDEGASWVKLTDQLGGELRTAPQFTQDGATTYLLGVNIISTRDPDGFPRLFASSDRGATWKRLNTNIPEAMELFASGSDLFIKSTQGGSYRLSKERATIRRKSAQANKLVVFPNPATQELSVTHPPGAYTYTIVSMTGIPLLTQTSQLSDHTELNVSGLPAGMYCLRVHNEQVSMQTLFVVVR